MLYRSAYRTRNTLMVKNIGSFVAGKASEYVMLISKPRNIIEQLQQDFKSIKNFKKMLKRNKNTINGFIAYSILFALIGSAYMREVWRQNQTVTINRLADDIMNKRLQSVVLEKRGLSTATFIYQVKAMMSDGSHYLVNIENPKELMVRLAENKIPFKVSKMHDNYYYYVNQVTINLSKVLIGVMVVSMIYMTYKERSMTKSGFGAKTSFQMINPTNIRKKFKDVAGVEEAKVEIQEYVDFLKNTTKYTSMGAKLPRGAILVGPPGTGKTLLAKACAAEAGVPFFYISGSEFVEGYVGVGARKVRQLFEEAREFAPSIIFIDELDAVGQKRGNSVAEKDNTLNQILVEMDGFGTDKGVIVFGATNIPDSLDDALKRPGRFDRIIELTLPDKAARAHILDVHLKKIHCHEDLKEDLANVTPGFSGADLENLVNEAAIVAAREGAEKVERKHFEAALERIVGGIATHKVLSEEIKERIAVHEAGKAVVSWFLETAAPILKMSLTPRSKRQAGYAQYLDQDRSLQSKEQLVDQLTCIISGKMAEEMILGESSTASESELKQVYKTCQRMVTKLGMSDEIGLLSLKDDTYKIYSDYTNTMIDREVNKIVTQAENQAKKILESKIDLVRTLAKKLTDKETLQHRDIVEVLGERPFKESESYKQYKDHIDILQKSK